MFSREVRYQLLATLSGNILSVGYGGVCGWPSASFLILQSDESPLETGPLSVEEASWVSSLIALGGVSGTMLFGLVVGWLGGKRSLLIAAVIQALSFLLIIIATNPIYLYVARFLAGLSGGATFVLLPSFVTEISDDRVRGTFGSLLVLFCNVGMLFAFVLGNYFNYYASPMVLLCIPCVFFGVFVFFPETPAFLMKTGKTKEAENSIRFYRNIRKGSAFDDGVLKMEFNKLENVYQTKLDETATWTLSDLNKPAARRALIIGIGLVALNQFCGCFAMLNYTATIFAESGSSLSPNMAAIVIGVIQLAGSYCSTLLVERAGRKFLLSFSAFTTGLGLACLGIYSYLRSLEYDMSSFGWLPVASFSMTIFVASLGVLTLPFMVIAEIMPEKIRSFGTTFCTFFVWIFAFLMIKFFPLLNLMLGMHGSMMLFTGCSWAGALFVLALLPETKGRSLDEIMEMLGGY